MSKINPQSSTIQLSNYSSPVHFANQSILVHSPKTAHHYGKDTRLIPMFPELREELEAQWELTEEGCSPYVIDKWRDTSANMRTHFQRIIFRAGLPEWDRLFQNLRASRSIDLCNEYPAYVEKAWLGHSEQIAEAHYLQVTDDHFQRALNPHPNSPANSGGISGTNQARDPGFKPGLPHNFLGRNQAGETA